MSRYGLIGANLSYSYSKIIHEELFNITDINCSYDLIETTSENIQNIINKLRTKEYLGFNITIPFKEEVLKYVDVLSDDVKEIGACNTLKLEDNKIVAYNTDIFGFEYLINSNNILLNDCFILGSGGACKTVCSYLNNLNINYKVISRKDNSYNYLEKNINNEIIINTTPVGTYPNNESILNKDVAQKASMIIDLIYNPKETLLMSYNKKSYNGLLMLVAQAVKSFEIWNNVLIDDKVIKEIIKKIEVKLYE